MLALLAALELRHVTLVGWSYGGATSIVAAIPTARIEPAREHTMTEHDSTNAVLGPERLEKLWAEHLAGEW